MHITYSTYCNKHVYTILINIIQYHGIMPALCLLNAFTGPLEEGLFICPSHSTRQLQCLEWHFTPSVGHLQGIARHGVIGIQGTALHGRLKADSGVLVWASRLVFQCSLLELRLQLSEDVPEPFRTPQDSKVSKKGLKRIYINDTSWYICAASL